METMLTVKTSALREKKRSNVSRNRNKSRDKSSSRTRQRKNLKSVNRYRLKSNMKIANESNAEKEMREFRAMHRGRNGKGQFKVNFFQKLAKLDRSKGFRFR